MPTLRRTHFGLALVATLVPLPGQAAQLLFVACDSRVCDLGTFDTDRQVAKVEMTFDDHADTDYAAWHGRWVASEVSKDSFSPTPGKYMTLSYSPDASGPPLVFGQGGKAVGVGKMAMDCADANGVLLESRFSLDGSKVYVPCDFENKGSGLTIDAYPSSGGPATRIFDPRKYRAAMKLNRTPPRTFTFAADGQRLAFVAGKTVFTEAIGSKKPQKLVDVKDSIVNEPFVVTERNVVYSSYHGNQYVLVVVDQKTGAAQDVFTYPKDTYSSSQGRKFAYDEAHDLLFFLSERDAPGSASVGRLNMLDLKTRKVSSVQVGVKEIFEVSPDGKWLIFSTQKEPARLNGIYGFFDKSNPGAVGLFDLGARKVAKIAPLPPSLGAAVNPRLFSFL
jgi:hypothetical protein